MKISNCAPPDLQRSVSVMRPPGLRQVGKRLNFVDQLTDLGHQRQKTRVISAPTSLPPTGAAPTESSKAKQTLSSTQMAKTSEQSAPCEANAIVPAYDDGLAASARTLTDRQALESSASGHVAYAFTCLMEGNTSQARKQLHRALELAPNLLGAWDLMLRCIDALSRDEKIDERHQCILMLARSLEAAWPVVDDASWLRLVQRFDAVRPSNCEALGFTSSQASVRRVRRVCEAVLFVHRADIMAKAHRWDQAGPLAYAAFCRDPYNMEAFGILSQGTNVSVDATLYEDAFRI